MDHPHSFTHYVPTFSQALRLVYIMTQLFHIYANDAMRLRQNDSVSFLLMALPGIGTMLPRSGDTVNAFERVLSSGTPQREMFIGSSISGEPVVGSLAMTEAVERSAAP